MLRVAVARCFAVRCGAVRCFAGCVVAYHSRKGESTLVLDRETDWRVGEEIIVTAGRGYM